MRGFLSSLNPRLPRTVQLLQLGGLMNAFGNGLVVPFLLIYLHNERGISRERWLHRYGCQQWFNVVRDTVTHAVRGSYSMRSQPPVVE